MPARVLTLPLSISNAYLLLGDRPVLVDAGAPKDGDRLVAALRQHGIRPTDLSLIALTHGHTDHTGAVAAAAGGGAPVAISATDTPLLRSGTNGVLPPTGPAGVMLAGRWSGAPSSPALPRRYSSMARSGSMSTESAPR